MSLASSHPGPGSKRGSGARYLVVLSLLVATIVAVSLINPAFATVQNFRDLLGQCAPVVIVGCGMTLVVLTGEIDISVGSLLGLLGALIGVLSSPQRLGLPPPVVVGLVLMAGAAVGLLNGVLVTAGRVPSIIATLGMLTVLRGVTELIMGGEWITDLPPGIRVLGIGSAAGMPWCLWCAAAVSLMFVVVAHRTRYGLRLYAIGGNPAAAAMAGIHTSGVKTAAFALLGLMTGVAALVTVPQQSVVESGIGVGFELVVVSAVVVGGTSIRGGHGGITGTVLAALLLCGVRPMLVFLKLGETATYWERAIQGGFILAAVLLDHWARRDARGRAVGVIA